MSKVISVNEFLFTVDELISLFNSKLQESLDSFIKVKSKVVSTGKNLDFIASSVSIWLDVDRCLVPQAVESEFKQAIEEAGWEITEYKWQKDERTYCDQILIRVKPKQQ